MSLAQDSLRIPTLNDDNFHVWKHRIQLVLFLREADEFIKVDPPSERDDGYEAWHKSDRKARALIGLSLSDNHLEQVQHASSAKEMWQLILDIFEKHTLLNKLAARRRFYTATMNDGEKVLEFASRVRQLAASLKSMGVTVDDQEMAMALLNGLPDRFDSLISALDALGNDEEQFTFEFVKSRCQQEEQRHIKRDEDTHKRSESAALLATRSKEKCVHCGKHYDSSKCFKKYPHLAPPGWGKKKSSKALVGKEEDSDSEEICLFGLEESKDCRTAVESRNYFCLAARDSADSSSKNWYIDSGCTAHMTYDRSAFTSYSTVPHSNVDLGANASATVVGEGIVKIQAVVNGKTKLCTIRNVKHVPTLRYQLLSVTAMAALGVRCVLDDDGAVLMRKSNKHILATGSIVNGLYALDTCSFADDTALVADLGLWHKRLAHVSTAGIKAMVDQGVVKGIQLRSSDDPDTCVGCILGKSHRSPIPKSSCSRASQLLSLVHSDVIGPLEVASVGGSKYIITFIDDHSNWVTEYTMSRKSEALDRFKQFKASAETHTNQVVQALHVHENRGSVGGSSQRSIKLKALRSDNGGEYLSGEFKQYLLDNGIKHELTVSYTPQQNGVAERMNRTLLNLVRSILHHSGVAKRFWAEALATAVYVRNRVTSRALPSKHTPHHYWHGKPPDLSHMRVFGARCWYVIPRAEVKKLDARAKEAVMMGYSKQSKGYKLWDVAAKKFVVSRDVKFDETRSADKEETQIQGESSESVSIPLVPDTEDEAVEETSQGENEDHQDPTLPSAEEDIPSGAVTALRRSSRARSKPGAWWVAQPSASTQDETTDSPTTSDVALIAQDVPQSYTEATRPDNIDFWAPGIKREEDSLRENKTFILVEREPHMHVLPCRYVFRVKSSGPKVRIVAKGFRQVHGARCTGWTITRRLRLL